MQNKKILVALASSLLFSQKISCATLAKNSVTTATVQQKELASKKERAIIEEIKSLLKDGKVPSLSFTQWVDTHLPVLLESKKEPVRTLGETLQAIRQGNTAKIRAFNVLPTFEKAVQAYDKKFYISMLSKPVIIAKGTYWYFSSPKKSKLT